MNKTIATLALTTSLLFGCANKHDNKSTGQLQEEMITCFTENMSKQDLEQFYTILQKVERTQIGTPEYNSLTKELVTLALSCEECKEEHDRYKERFENPFGDNVIMLDSIEQILGDTVRVF